MNDETLYTTEQAANQIGITRQVLLLWINRWPEYRPKLQMGKGAWVWTQAEIDRAKAGRAETRKLAGRQAKKQV
jgi:hypothetical protein